MSLRLALAWERFADWVGDHRNQVAWLILALIVAGGCASLIGGGSDGSNSGSDVGAVLACEDFVERELRAPSTADFPSTSDAEVNRTGDRWRVSSHVDSENGFGAMIRSDWTCTVELDGDTWRGNVSLTSR